MVDYVITFDKKGVEKHHRLNNAPCFGRLKSAKEIVEWHTGSANTWGDPSYVSYYPEVQCQRDAATAWYQYLIDHPLWGAYLVGEHDANLIGTEGMPLSGSPKDDISCVRVSTDANPHQLLNTLSMFRKPHKYSGSVRIWHELVKAGCDPDAAAICSMLLQMDGEVVRPSGYEDGEHAVFSRRMIGADELRLYVSYRKDGVSSLDYYKPEVTSYREYKKYERNGEFPVTGWIVGYRGTNYDNDDMLETIVFPAEYIISYDKEKKEVVNMIKRSKPVAMSDLSSLVESINALAGV